MSIWAAIRAIFGQGSFYSLVWREHASGGALMKGEPVFGKSDTDAISLVRARFMHAGPDWAFWVLFRPDETMVTAEQGPKFAKWPGDFTHIATESHVLHTMESVRRHGKAVSRPLHKIKLKTRGQASSPIDAE